MRLEAIRKLYPEGIQMDSFEHIESISSYNSNYYIGKKGHLLYCKSDDDNTSEWYLINGDYPPTYFGVSLCSDNEKLYHYENT